MPVRGISRERAGVYKRVLGPSRDLLRAFKDDAIGWDEYEVRYLDEMKGEAQQGEIVAMAQLARSQTVTIMCVCKDGTQCHRRLLVGLIERGMVAA
jgi:uncharacterized protein YeaO (DUF488 family)